MNESHPALIAPYGSNLVSRHLLRIEGGGLRVRDFQVRAFEGLDLYGVSLTLPGKAGGLTLLSADTVTVNFNLKEALGAVPHLRRVVVASPEIYSMAGNDTTSSEDSGTVDLGLPQLLIDHLVIQNGFLEFSDSGGRMVQRIPHIDLQGEVETGQEVRAILRTWMAKILAQVQHELTHICCMLKHLTPPRRALGGVMCRILYPGFMSIWFFFFIVVRCTSTLDLPQLTLVKILLALRKMQI